MKIDEIKNLDVKELTEMLISEGIGKNRLDGAISSTYLPAKGVFTHFTVEGEAKKDENGNFVKDENGNFVDSFRHVVLHTANGEQISLSRLQARGFKPTETETEPKFKAAGERAIKPGSLYMVTNYDVNPSLQGNQAAILKKIIGKPFTAIETEYLVQVYDPNGVYDETDAKTKTQKSYIVDVK